MKIKKDNKTVISGSAVCMAAGIIAGICGLYWLIRALAYDDSNLSAMLSGFALALFLIPCGRKR